MAASYAELQVTSEYFFLRGASLVEGLFEQADRLGLAALGITDRNSSPASPGRTTGPRKPVRLGGGMPAGFAGQSAAAAP